jgi:putative spermidine/putrescine transport system permease protein/spermidine/putrescine transport system permease protein
VTTPSWPVRLLLWLIAGCVLLLLYGPLLVPATFSFFRLERNEVQWRSFSLDAYAALFRNASIMTAMGNTLLVGMAAVVLALVLGTIFAFHHQSRPGRAREVLQVIIFLPFLMPPILTGLSLLIFFRELDIPRSLLTVVIGHTVFVLAIAYRTILSRLQALSAHLTEASLDLGASRLQTFRHVLLPNLATAFIASAVLAFALSFDETLITLLVTGTSTTLPMRLWGMMRLGFTPDINALVVLVLAVTTLLAVLAARWLTVPAESNG